jgi:hypothetical protein
VGFGTADVSVADWLAELNQKPKPIAASPAPTTTPISVRIFEILLYRVGNKLLNFCVVKKVALLTLCNFRGIKTRPDTQSSF